AEKIYDFIKMNTIKRDKQIIKSHFDYTNSEKEMSKLDNSTNAKIIVQDKLEFYFTAYAKKGDYFKLEIIDNIPVLDNNDISYINKAVTKFPNWKLIYNGKEINE